MSDTERFLAFLKETAKRIAPDYPGINEAEPWECLWAITASYEGTLSANRGLHKVLNGLRQRFNLEPIELVEMCEEIRRDYEKEMRRNTS